MFLATACICTCLRVWSSTVDIKMSVLVWMDMTLYLLTTYSPENWDRLSLHVALKAFPKAPLEKDSSSIFKSILLENRHSTCFVQYTKIWRRKLIVNFFRGFTNFQAFNKCAIDNDFGKTVLLGRFPRLARDGETGAGFVARSVGFFNLPTS